jgi:acetylornithine deacetylase/succinyl-diaminopimelate desuccinylase-like protein
MEATFMSLITPPVRILAIALVTFPLFGQSEQQLARDIFKQLIEINTTDSTGDNTRAAEAMAARFRQAGFPESDIHVLGPRPRKGNLVVRLHGAGRAKPILFIGHLDVVEAKGSDWSFDPFVFREQDGFYYGRGTSDMKGDVSILVETFLRMKRDGFRPARDMILALTSDEEGGTANGVEWLVKNHRDLIDAEFCINPDGGGGVIKNGKRMYMSMEAAEKVFLSFKLEVTNKGGHSSLPTKDNAIYHLAEGLARLAKFDFSVHLFDVTQLSFERMAPLYGGQLGQDMKAVAANPSDAAGVRRLSAAPEYNAQLRTTCIATMLAGGHAENALPQSASAVVNCRMLPVEETGEVERTLNQVLADPRIHVSALTPAKAVPYSPISSKILNIVAAATAKRWPGQTVIPTMLAGGTDGIYLISAGIPTYGVSGLYGDEDDVRAHGRDERLLVKAFDDALPFFYELSEVLAQSE